MKFLLDHCVLGKTRRLLKEAGYSVTTLNELGKATSTDSEVINIAIGLNVILITCDLDFSDIRIYPSHSHLGIIVLKMIPLTEKSVHSILLKALAELKPSEITKSLIVVDHNKYRIRR